MITVQGEATINKPLEGEIIVFSIILKITPHLEKLEWIYGTHHTGLLPRLLKH